MTSIVANYGFSLGINDVIPGPVLSKTKDELVEKAYADCQDLIALAKKGKLENKPGCDQEQTLEAMISSVLSKVREAVGQICMRELSRQNAPLIMATCGSKGVFKFKDLFFLLNMLSQVPSSTSLRWWLVSDNKSSLDTVCLMDSKIVLYPISQKNPKNHPRRDSCGIVSILDFGQRNSCSMLSLVVRVWSILQ